MDAVDRYLNTAGGKAGAAAYALAHPSAGTGAPIDFQNAILNALAYRGIDTSQLSAQDISALIQRYWDDPTVQRTYLNEVAKGSADPSAALRARVGPVVPSQNLGVTIPKPWSVGGEAISGYGFGAPDPDYGPGGVHPGADYGVPEGTTLTTPFAGTVVFKYDQWLGYHAEVSFGNGWKLIYGHMATPAYQLNVPISFRSGQTLGLSDTTGNADGPHVHFEVRDPKGVAVDPKVILDPIFQGTTYGQLLAKLPQLGSGIVGTPVTQGEALLDPAQAELQRRASASHIPGMTVGQYEDLYGIANAAFSKAYGYRVPDSLLRDLYNRGQTSPEGVQYEIDQLPFQPGKQVTPLVFNQVYGSAAAWEAAIWNQTPHPLTLQAIYQGAGAPTDVPATQAAQLAQTAKPLSVVQGGQQ
jgi:murein DD-endopeptidase MepM/ murein hydrolase activator NlpD